MANGDDRQAFNESLIDAIEREACLWDLRNKQYKKRSVCDAAWRRVKARWKNLRDTFRRTLKERNRATKSGAPAGDDLDEATQWIFFKRLLLLKDTIEGRPGIREADTRRLIQAFCLCKITYALPYLYLSPLERDQVDRLIRTAYKTALHLPNSTPTSKLLQLGVHNTIDELVQAHLISQYTRLSQSETGRQLLQRLQINLIGRTSSVQAPTLLRGAFHVEPVPGIV
ncbi:hypothetical protein HPB50_019388 [Hyalomma asiaticum]|uniref:Uncharacterized protein n=1 Tax=Hyalomma asiaticum TaxID=266040 RepID=A0ACB7S059_HYAAI|nr:hypothetical protein HPB50_019388 [Hyalomma asiaticum]